MVYNITIKSSVVEGFQLKVDCINAEQDVLTHVQNPKITKTKNQNLRIRGLHFQEGETQDLLPAHMFGVSRRRRNTRFTSCSHHACCFKKKEKHKIYFPFTSCLVFQEEGETQDLFPFRIMLGVSRGTRNTRFISCSHHAWCFKKKEKHKIYFPFTSCLVFQEEGETQEKLPVHVMFGVSDYPLAEFTKPRWTLCGEVARKTQSEKQYFVNDEKSEFQKLSSLDVLGLENVMQSKEL